MYPAHLFASTASDSLLAADRALAAASREQGFVEAYSKSMGPDARKLDGGRPAAIGHDASMAVLSSYGNHLKLDWTPEEAVVAESGELGFTWGHFVQSGVDKAHKTIYRYGKYLDVWRRGEDGVWRWIADIGTGDPAPTAPGSAAASSEFARIPAGAFEMGSDPKDLPSEQEIHGFPGWEQPRHRVAVKAFQLARLAVTRGEFASFVTATGYAAQGCNVWDGFEWSAQPDASWRAPGFSQTDRDPVVCVSSADAEAYIAWYGKQTGRHYRLPSEAEWEYAARAGSTTIQRLGENPPELCSHANGSASEYSAAFPQEPDVNKACSDGYLHTAPVGSLRPNSWGLYDMQGNVWQWTADCRHENYEVAPTDGSAWLSDACDQRVYRGGSWYDGPWLLRATTRHFGKTDGRYNGVGFRLARTAIVSRQANRRPLRGAPSAMRQAPPR